MDNEHVSVKASQVLQIAFSLGGPVINPVTAGNNTCCSANKPEKCTEARFNKGLRWLSEVGVIPRI